MGTTAQKLQAILDSKAAIKDAIEGKGVTVGSASLDQYASKIEQIPAPIVEAPENDVNFYDYDGFRVASYTIAEAKALTALPTPPTHEGLTFQEWNWTLADIQGYNRKYIDIGANYVPTDGKTHIKISTQESGLVLHFFLTITVREPVVVDWGDGTTPTEVSTTSSGATGNATHTYATSGDFDCKIYPKNGNGNHSLGISSDSSIRTKITEINYSSYISAVSLNSASGISCPVSIPTAMLGGYNIRYTKIPQLTVPRGTTSEFNTTDGMRENTFHLCFPKNVPQFSGLRYMNLFTNRLIIPEITNNVGFSNTSLYGSWEIKILSLPLTFQYTAAPSTSQGLNQYACLEEIEIVQGWTPIYSMSFAASTSYMPQTLVDFFNKLGTTTNAITLTFGSTNLDKLTAEEKAIATNKGYTLA